MSTVVVQLGPLQVDQVKAAGASGESNQVGSSNWISLGVLGPLRLPAPTTSPVAIDAAMAWFYPTQKMDAVANLCALAGVNWVRDRLNWAEMELFKCVSAATLAARASRCCRSVS